MIYSPVQRVVLVVDNRHMPRESLKEVVRAMKEEEEDGRYFGGGGRTTTTTTTMATVTATDRSSGGGTHTAGVRRPRWVGGDDKERDLASQEDKIGPVVL